MPLNSAQLVTLKAAINAETDPTFVSYRQAGSTGQMAEWLNALASPAHLVWSTGVPVSAVLDAIAFDAYTPNPAVDATALFTNRMLLVQTKQMNLQNMLIGRERIDASRQRVRAGLLDAVTNLPTGAGFAAASAGGTGGDRVMNALTRPATRGEKVFATATAQTGNVTANLLTFEGFISDADVVLALNA